VNPLPLIRPILDFGKHFLKVRALIRQLSESEAREKKLALELEASETRNKQLRQENENLNQLLHAKPIDVETHFDI
jgi:hypothetical protein